MTSANSRLEILKTNISRCTICSDPANASPLPHKPRPVLVASTSAKIAICGQAPGTRVHASGIPFTDPSGDRLRTWLEMDEATFYDASKLAIVPMGFCFPGLDTKGGDLPPRRECRATWHQQVFDAMPQLKLLLIIGIHAQKWHMGNTRKKNLTQTVAAWHDYVDRPTTPALFPLPHPSWRNNGWLKKNPWFESELLPVLRNMVRDNLAV